MNQRSFKHLREVNPHPVVLKIAGPRLPHLSCLLAVLGAVVLMGCNNQEHSPAPTQNLQTATVRVAPVQQLERTAVEEVVGTVRPKLSATIAAKVSGTIQQMLVSVGDSVKTGQTLAQLDAAEIQARLDQAQAVREQASRDIERFEKLFAQKAVTQQEYENVKSRFQVAEATVAEARTMLGYTKVLAPFDGVVSAKHADVGDLASPAKPLLQLEDPRNLRFEADVPEMLSRSLKLHDKLDVNLPDLDKSLEAVVQEIAPVADPVSRTFRVKLDLPTREGIRSGQFGRLQVPGPRVSAIRIPAKAVLVRGQMEIVFVAVNQHAQMRLIKTGKKLGGEVEVLSGLEPGESLVVEPTAELRDGQPLEVRQ